MASNSLESTNKDISKTYKTTGKIEAKIILERNRSGEQAMENYIKMGTQRCELAQDKVQ
jgi:hypothetical protein